MQVPYNEMYQKQNTKLIPDTQRKAIVSSVNQGQRQVNLYFVNNPNSIVKNVSVSASIDIGSLAPGTKVKVDVFDETNPNDMVVAYAYGGTASSGSNATITYVSSVVLNNVGGVYSISVSTKHMTFVNGRLTSFT